MQRATRLFRAALLSSVSALACALTPSPIRAAPPTAAALLDSARAEFQAGRAVRSEQLARQALALSPPVSLAAADALDVLVSSLHKQRRFADAETRQMAERALLLRETLLPPTDPQIEPSLYNLARQLEMQAEYARAQTHFERLLALRVLLYGAQSPLVANAYDGLGIVHRQQGNYETARRQFEQALEIRRSRPEEPALAKSFDYLGIVCGDLGQFAQARKYFDEALAIRVKAFGADASVVADTRGRLANVHQSLGQYSEARRQYEAALRIRELAGEPLGTAETSRNLGELLVDMGDYAAARPHLERALALRVKHLGPEDPFVASNTCELGALEHLTGDYAGALVRFDRGLRIMESSLGGEHPFVAERLSEWVDVLRAVGDEEEALRLCERALAIQEKALGRRHPEVGRTLHRMGAIRLALGSPDAAVPLLEEALAIQQEALGAEHADVARTSVDLGSAVAGQGDVVEAGRLFDSALRNLDGVLGMDHPVVAEARQAYANVLFAAGDLSRARSLEAEAVRALETSLGPETPRLAPVLGHQAVTLALLGELEAALEAAARAERITREHLRLTARALPERQALHYASQRGRALDVLLTLAAERGAQWPAACEQAWEAVLRSRCLVLDEMAARQRAVEAISDPETAHRVAELVAVRQRLANLVVRGPGSMPPADHRALIDATRLDAERRTRVLAQSIPWLREEYRRDRVGAAQIAAVLPAGSRLVSFVRFKRVALGGARVTRSAPSVGPAYLAFVARPGDRVPQVVPLGDATTVDTLVTRWREALGVRVQQEGAWVATEMAARAAGESLRRAVWDAVVPCVGKTADVYLVLDGALQLVDLALLPADPPAYIMETGPFFHVLGTERDLVSPRRPTHARGLFALGNPDCDASPALSGTPQGEIRLAPASSRRDPVLSDGSATWRGAPGPCGFESLRFRPLPASAHEVDELVGVWCKATATQTERWIRLIGLDASESRFKREAPGHRVLHLAAHAFFLDGTCAAGIPGDTRGIRAMASSPPALGSRTTPPLLLSGLALKGANHRADADSSAEDGILTAEEVAGLDLAGVDLVALSACDTGLGPLQAGEGMLGLRRAFAIAGARTQLTSLWPVRDEIARRWMRSFYEALLGRGLGTSQAARTANLECLQWARHTHGSGHPMLWAGFVATGALE